MTNQPNPRVPLLDIVEVAARSGVRASTLRFYEEKGLITSVGRRGLRRLFEPSVLERLAFVALGQAAGFSLDEIAGMFTPDGRVNIDRGRLAERADQLDGTIRQLTAMRDGLRHAAVCPARSHRECPTFRRLLRAAAAGALAQSAQAAAVGPPGRASRPVRGAPLARRAGRTR
jgi:DNA-binding transcriptional MerR regulator